MFASPSINYRPNPSRPAVKVAIVIAGIAVLVGFALLGTVFLGLAIAGPIAVPIAEQRHLWISAHDMAIAKQLASFAWLFAIASVASYGAAVATIVKLIQRLDPTEE